MEQVGIGPGGVLLVVACLALPVFGLIAVFGFILFFVSRRGGSGGQVRTVSSDAGDTSDSGSLDSRHIDWTSSSSSGSGDTSSSDSGWSSDSGSSSSDSGSSDSGGGGSSSFD